MLKKRTSNDQVKVDTKINNTASKIVAVTFIILSGLILYLDKIFELYDIQLKNNHGFNDTVTFVWSLSTSVSPILILIAFYLLTYKSFKHYNLSLLVPLYCYLIQFWYVIDSSLYDDFGMLQLYILGSIILIVIILLVIVKLLNFQKSKDSLKIKIMDAIISADNKLLDKDNNG